jgi:hypothetical protein
MEKRHKEKSKKLHFFNFRRVSDKSYRLPPKRRGRQDLHRLKKYLKTGK